MSKSNNNNNNSDENGPSNDPPLNVLERLWLAFRNIDELIPLLIQLLIDNDIFDTRYPNSYYDPINVRSGPNRNRIYDFLNELGQKVKSDLKNNKKWRNFLCRTYQRMGMEVFKFYPERKSQTKKKGNSRIL